MALEHPTVLLVDQDGDSLDRILVAIEPIFDAYSLRSPGSLLRYVQRLEPDLVVLSDRLSFRRKETPAFLAALRAEFRGPILILTDHVSEKDRALWKERGATDCVLHPTRVADRLVSLTRKILDVTAPAYSRTP